MCSSVLRPPLHVRANRRGRRVERRHAVTLDDLPPALVVWEVGGALVHHGGGGVAEWPVDDVAVAGDPANVGGAPVDVCLRLEVEDHRVGRCDADEIAAGRVRDPLWLRRRSGRVHEEQQILTVHRLARAGRKVVGDVELVVPVVTPLRHFDGVSRATHHDGRANPGGRGHRLVRDALQRHGLPTPPGLVLRDEDFAVHVIDPV